jgi:hypothetical protein
MPSERRSNRPALVILENASDFVWLGGRDSSTFALRAPADLIASLYHPPESRAEPDGWVFGTLSRNRLVRAA